MSKLGSPKTILSIAFLSTAFLLAACTPLPTAAPEPGQPLTEDEVATILAAPLPAGVATPGVGTSPPPITPIPTPDLNQVPATTASTATPTRSPAVIPTGQAPTAGPNGYPPPAQETPASSPTAAPTSQVPNFSHIFILIFENKEFGSVIGNTQMPNINRLADENTLLTDYYAVRHPSLPNYIALIGGDTFGIATDCEDCMVDAPSLPDLIEASDRTWRTYQEDMPKACFLGGFGDYAQKHNPFIYFDPIRNNQERCQAGIVPLTRLDADLAGGSLPNFVFITPNICNSGHDCSLRVTDDWAGQWVDKLMASPAYDSNSLIVLTWDEGQGEHTCCGLVTGGGRVATVLISPLARSGFEDDTPYSHYSLLATIAEAWGLKKLGNAANPETTIITAPWQ